MDSWDLCESSGLNVTLIAKWLQEWRLQAQGSLDGQLRLQEGPCGQLKVKAPWNKYECAKALVDNRHCKKILFDSNEPQEDHKIPEWHTEHLKPHEPLYILNDWPKYI